MARFRHIIREVRTGKGLEESKHPGMGFLRTTDVHIKPRKGLEKYFKDRGGTFFEEILKGNTPATYHIRVFIEGELNIEN
jgi:hypothetical protein